MQEIEAGKTYVIRGGDGKFLERKVTEIGKTHLTYIRQGRPTKCQIETFKRIVAEHGVN